MLFRYLFKRKSSLHSTENQVCLIQIPSAQDTAQMSKMPAGSDEDQLVRLSHMIEVIARAQSINPSLPVVDTDKVRLPEYWSQLFSLIKEGKLEDALTVFAEIPNQDKLLQALLSVHSIEYLQDIIRYCIQARAKGWQRLNADILITPGTFEVLIKDIALTLLHSGKIHFSFGLPSHHAFADEGSGFCILNKTAILIKYGQSICKTPLKHIIVGTDVNRDNGLCDILINSTHLQDVAHVDIFDSRVYPGQDSFFINRAFKQVAKEVGQQISVWQREGYEYFAVDLSVTVRKSDRIHPALAFALEKIVEQIDAAKAHHQKVALYLPSGWDSHENETAYCGKYVDGKIMGTEEARKTRFNDGDLIFFYDKLFKLYQKNKEHIERVYWGLEGGYDRKMYERQIQLLMTFIWEKLVHRDVKTDLHRRN